MVKREETGCGKSKLMVTKMELLISQLVDLIRNAISTTKPMFSKLSNATELLRIIST